MVRDARWPFLQEAFISRVNSVFIPIILLLLLSLFVWMSSSVAFVKGLGSADDGLFAIVSKHLAFGPGYGMPLSSWVFSRFDPAIGTGPALIFPAALLTWLFGPVDWIGVLALAIFLCQILIAGFVLARRFGLVPVAGFLFVSLVLIIRFSLSNMYFWLLVGKAPAFGFVLLGTAVLATNETCRASAVVGVLFSFAFLTKQITLFPIAGVVACWFTLGIYEHVLR